MTREDVERRARELLATEYARDGHARFAREIAAGNLNRTGLEAPFRAICTALTTQAAEIERLRRALEKAKSWLEYDNSQMGPAETQAYWKLRELIDAALQPSDWREG